VNIAGGHCPTTEEELKARQFLPFSISTHFWIVMLERFAVYKFGR
jgi:hypothetical protein